MTETEIYDESRAIVLYDGQCPLCQKSVQILKRLDWLDRLQFHDARALDQLPKSKIPLDSQRLLEEMHLLTPDRTQAPCGFRAFRWMAWRLPALWPLAPWLMLPGVPWLGQKVYLWIARRRYQLVPCSDGACTVALPQKAPE